MSQQREGMSLSQYILQMIPDSFNLVQSIATKQDTKVNIFSKLPQMNCVCYPLQQWSTELSVSAYNPFWPVAHFTNMVYFNPSMHK